MILLNNVNDRGQRYCIFDFDGTLVDSFYMAIEKLNNLSEEFGFQKIAVAEITELKNCTAKELISHLKIPLYKLPHILYKAKKEIKNEILNLAPFVGIYQVLQRLYDAKIGLGIVSSNSEENLKIWLQSNKMDHFFQFVHSASNIFGKAMIIKKVLKKYGIDKNQAYYIGDEIRDIEAAQKNDIYSISVTWGFNSEKILAQYKPDYLVQKPQDVLKILDVSF